MSVQLPSIRNLLTSARSECASPSRRSVPAPASHARPDVLTCLLVELQADGRSPHTRAQYQRHVRRFEAWATQEGVPDDVAAVEPEHVACFLASAEAHRRHDGRTKRVGSLNALRSSLRGSFEYCERAGLVERSRARVLRMARVGATPPKGLEPDDVAAQMTALAADTTMACRYPDFHPSLWTSSGRQTPAMAAGLAVRPLTLLEILRCRPPSSW